MVLLKKVLVLVALLFVLGLSGCLNGSTYIFDENVKIGRASCRERV